MSKCVWFETVPPKGKSVFKNVYSISILISSFLLSSSSSSSSSSSFVDGIMCWWTGSVWKRASQYSIVFFLNLFLSFMKFVTKCRPSSVSYYSLFPSSSLILSSPSDPSRATGGNDAARTAEWRVAHQHLVDLASRLTTLGDGPHNQRLSTSAICNHSTITVMLIILLLDVLDDVSTSSSKDAGYAGGVFAWWCFDVAAGILIQLQLVDDVTFGTDESHC